MGGEIDVCKVQPEYDKNREELLRGAVQNITQMSKHEMSRLKVDNLAEEVLRISSNKKMKITFFGDSNTFGFASFQKNNIQESTDKACWNYFSEFPMAENFPDIFTELNKNNKKISTEKLGFSGVPTSDFSGETNNVLKEKQNEEIWGDVKGKKGQIDIGVLMLGVNDPAWKHRINKEELSAALKVLGMSLNEFKKDEQSKLQGTLNVDEMAQNMFENFLIIIHKMKHTSGIEIPLAMTYPKGMNWSDKTKNGKKNHDAILRKFNTLIINNMHNKQGIKQYDVLDIANEFAKKDPDQKIFYQAMGGDNYDELHFNAKGHELIAYRLQSKMKEMLADRGLLKN